MNYQNEIKKFSIILKQLRIRRIPIFIEYLSEYDATPKESKLQTLKNIMMIKYDKEVDVLYIKLSQEEVMESDERKPGIILDFSDKGHIVGIEILDASTQISLPNKVEYEVA